MAGKSIKIAFDADPVSLDPHVQLSAGMIQYAHMVFDPLIRWNKQGGFDGRLATKWERIDSLTVRFYLRKGVKFHSGNAFTAKDVAWTLARLKKSQDFKALFDPFVEPVIVDDYTIDIKTSKPYPLVLNMCTYIFPWTASSTQVPMTRDCPRMPLSKPSTPLPMSTNPGPANTRSPFVSRASRWFSPSFPNTGTTQAMWMKSS
jgi:peptide/nickel transport system substrate-binding protein